MDGEGRGRIGKGLLLFAGFTHTDTAAEVDWMADKIAGLRIFPDSAGKMNVALAEAGAAVLVVSQFTLYGSSNKGRRPSFIGAARPETAIPLYESFKIGLAARGLQVESGEFGAMMDVELVNDGPVTLWLEREAIRTSAPDGG